MDGYGLAPPGKSNAISCAATPELDALFAAYPHTELSASGLDVGLPAGQIGNSEVGHMNIGAGRVVFQDLPRISNAVGDGSFFQNGAYRSAMTAARESGKKLHIIGLLSDGGVHSHIEHLYALLTMAKQRGLAQVYIHALLDGRDVGPHTGLQYVRDCVAKCGELGIGEIATVQGRFYGMDRDKRWERVQRGYDAIVRGEGVHNPDPADAVEKSYAQDITDEFLLPTVCDAAGLVETGDSVIFLNFRPDRAREITRALLNQLPEGCTLDVLPMQLYYVCTTLYDAAIRGVNIAFPPEPITGTFGEYISSLGLTQLRIAETEKYAHVTFFFNGGQETVYPGEDRVLIPSTRAVPTYDLAPEMSAEGVTAECVRRIESGRYDVVICNLANCDMVGHTGVREATIRAVEKVDECVGRITRATLSMGGVTLVTADHGNADCVIGPDGAPHTAHTTNPVPLILVGADAKLRSGRFCDLAPTMLALMGLAKPSQMTGKSLIQ